MRNGFTTIAAGAAAALIFSGLTAPAEAAVPAAQAKAGERSLAQVLAADGQRFDRKWHDFDILDAAVGAVLAEKPGSDVAVLAQGDTRLTAFLPTDRAFRKLVRSLTGRTPRTERATFTALATAAGIDTIETVLLYHVVPGATITRYQAIRSDGAALTTAQGGKVVVDVRGRGEHRRVILKDRDPDALNPRIVRFNINKGNKQIGHAINRVLRPIDL